MAGRILIVDDAAFIREVLTQILVKKGFEVVGEATNGNEAVELALKENPDVILMDIVMPEKSGLQAAEEILEQKPELPIIACSTENSEAMITKALSSGCCNFIMKPFKVDELVETIKSAIKKKEN